MTRSNAWRTLRELAGSRKFSVFVFVLCIAYASVLSIFRIAFGVEERWLYILADLWPYKLACALFFVNLVVLGIGWVPAVMRTCRRAPLAERLDQTVRSGRETQVPADGLQVGDFERYLRRRGYRVHGDAGHATGVPAHAVLVAASRGKYSLIGNLLFHAGFVLLLAGAVVNALYHFAGTTILAEGDSFSGARKEYLTTAGGRWGRLPEVDFDVEAISADLWDGRMLFTRLEARLLHRGGRELTRVNDSLRVGDAEVLVSGYGYAPRFELKDKDGRIVDMGTVKLNIFGPGNEDFFYIPRYPHKIFVSFYPDHALVDGKVLSRSMNPRNPAYFLRIFRGRIPVYTGLIKSGESARFDGLSLSFPSFARSAEFRIFRNPGNPVIWTAFVVMLAGLAWRLIFYRKELVLWRDEQGRSWLTGRADFYPKLNAAWLERLAERFGSS